MATNISVIYFKAPIKKVWSALTEPQIVKQWQYGSDLITDWKVGNPIRFRAEWEGKVFEQWGKVLEFTPNKILKYSLFAPRPELEDKPENYFTMTYILTREKGQIRLEIIQEDTRKGAVQAEPQGEENPVLKNLKTIIER
jgi:uncharacterized protein YndB with AHSA1/START domain